MANLPAEITHLYEEVQAKDLQIQESRNVISVRDSSLQKFIKLNGSLVQNPKEEPYSKLIAQHYERAQLLQEEKIALVEKAAALVSRHLKGTVLEAACLCGTDGPPRQATRHQITGFAERWVDSERPPDAVAVAGLAWQHGPSTVAS